MGVGDRVGLCEARGVLRYNLRCQNALDLSRPCTRKSTWYRGSDDHFGRPRLRPCVSLSVCLVKEEDGVPCTIQAHEQMVVKVGLGTFELKGAE